MRFSFSDDQRQFCAAFSDLLAKECRSEVVRQAWADSPNSVQTKRDLWQKLVTFGIAGMTVPVRAGGLGFDAVDTVLLFEEAGACALPLPMVETVAMATPLLAAATAGESDAWLSRIASGEAIFSCAMAPDSPVAHVDVAGAIVVVSGDEVHLVPAKEAVASRATSVDRSRELGSLGKSALTSKTRILSGETAIAAIARARDWGAVATSGELIGVARRLIEKTVAYAKERVQFGVPIGTCQAVKHHLAEAWTKVAFARPVVHRAAYSVAKAASDRALHASMAKAVAAEAATFAARIALQCHGAIGYSYEHDLHLWLKRAWALSEAGGGPAWHREQVAAIVLDRANAVRN